MSKTLIVDLDGTLLRSDMLYETFWNAFARKWYAPIVAAKKLLSGKAAMKSYLMGSSDVEIGLLPFDEKIIGYIEAYRNKGGRVALVTATHQSLAKRIAEHLKIFDEVFGSDCDHNLKGTAKAQFLVQRYGRGNFVYMGDAHADLPVWKESCKIVTVNASKSLRKQSKDLDVPTEHLQTLSFSYLPYIKVLRPHQWMKNILVFLPMFASHEFNTLHFMQSIYAFIAFCCIASSVYVLNDLLDLNADRAHPRKRFRPFASGEIAHPFGIWALVSLICVGVIIAQSLGVMFMITLGAYYLITLAYSLVLKRKIVIDICVLAGLYTMRILAGAVATGIELSVWLLAFSIFFFFSLGSVKRQAELVDLSKRNELNTSGRGYTVQDLPIISVISVTAGYISILVMALYINSPAVIELYQTPEVLWGICCVLIYWITRVVFITQRGLMNDDPVVFACTDRTSLICFLIVAVSLIMGALI